MMTIAENDLGAIALGRVATQYRESEKLRATISAFVAECTEAQRAAFSSLEGWNLDDATGAALDVIGNIVGHPRPLVDATIYGYFGYATYPGAESYGDATAPEVGGRYLSVYSSDTGRVPMEDEDYRAHIRAKILKNGTSATPEDVLEVIRAVFPDVSPVSIAEQSLASAQITLGRLLSTVEKGVLTGEELIPIPIAVSVTYADSLGALAFGYAGSVGSGYGTGQYASLI